MTSFRSFLARERLVPVEQLDRALQRQILYGEDLAVNLLEMGAVDEDELAQFLGMFYRLPIVTRSDLQSVTPQVIAHLPAAAATRHRICPVAVADEMMVVAATRQLERGVQAELEHLTGKTISLAVASPLTMAWGLHRHYGVEMPPRYQRILERQPRKEGEPVRPPKTPLPGEPPPEPEQPERPRRSSGIIVMPDDVPASELASVTEASVVPSTPEASVVPPPPMTPRPGVPPALPPQSEFEAARVSSAAEEVLRGISLSHDNPADRLLEMVLGPASDAPRPSRVPTAPAEATGEGAPDAAAEPGAAPTTAETEPTAIEPPAVPPPSAAVELVTATADIASMVGTPPEEQHRLPVEPEAPAAAPPAAVELPAPTTYESPIAEAGPRAEAVVRVQAVLLGTGEEPRRRPSRPPTRPPAIEAILGVPAGTAPAPATRATLISRITKMDTLSAPTDVLRFSFQLFSAPFRSGILFDTTSHNPRLRDAFGVQAGAANYRGRELAQATLPPTVRNASQPLLARVEAEGPLAELLRELFGEVPVNALFLPITVGTRVVAVMYGDNRGEATSFESVRELFHLSWAVGTRLGELIRRRRRHAPADVTDPVGDTERGVPPSPIDRR